MAESNGRKVNGKKKKVMNEMQRSEENEGEQRKK